MVHALGGGLRIYEIQQSSDVTYRLWDWNRTGPDGKKRALHMEDALAVARPLTGRKLSGVARAVAGGRETVYICDGNFELWRLDASGRMALNGGRMRLITSLGRGVLGWEGGALPLSAGDSVLIPADTQAWVEGNLSLLMSLPSDRAGLKALLGERAGQVAGLNEEEA
jgi:mannose-6-phosphate isomerase